jgi:hypothetical protein
MGGCQVGVSGGQDLKALLSEVAVKGEDSVNASLTHQFKTGVIHQTDIPATSGEQGRYCSSVHIRLNPYLPNCWQSIIDSTAKRAGLSLSVFAQTGESWYNSRKPYRRRTECSEQTPVTGKSL